jgi:pimeloyl-ACP methyl ester carboxylesterase
MRRFHFTTAAIAIAFLPLWASADCVVLLHGLARTADAMNKLELSLTARKFAVANIDYPSRHKTIEELAPLAVTEGVRRCEELGTEKVHFVTHSMGGILVRYFLANNDIENLGRVVMIAPPNHGSQVVDNLANVPGFAFVNGPAGLQLGTDPNSIPSKLGPVTYSVGVIAGSKTFNPILSQFLPNPDDGKVSVESTKVEGMADFIVVDVSHPFIMEDDTVIEHVIEFLTTGSFGANSP